MHSGGGGGACERSARTKAAIDAHFEHLAEVLEERKQLLKRAVDEAQAGKQKVLEGQREGLEYAVASMVSGIEHARRTAKLGDDYEIMHAYSQIVGGMRGLKHRAYELHPNTSASISFVDTSAGGLAKTLSQHARILAHNVLSSQCTAEGRGLKRAHPGGWASLTVQAVNHTGEPCSDGGDNVGIRLVGVAAEDELDLATDVHVVDRGDGTYKCKYCVAKDTRPQMARLEVLVNGGHVSDSPFSISIQPYMPDAFHGHTVVYGNREYFTLPKGCPTKSAFPQDSVQHPIPEDSEVVVATWPDFDDIRRNVIAGYPWETCILHCRANSGSNVAVAYHCKGSGGPFAASYLMQGGPGGQHYEPFASMSREWIQMTGQHGRVLLRRAIQEDSAVANVTGGLDSEVRPNG